MRPLEEYECSHRACCGQLVAWKVKVKARNSRRLQFCSDNCVQVYDSYLVPLMGRITC